MCSPYGKLNHNEWSPGHMRPQLATIASMPFASESLIAGDHRNETFRKDNHCRCKESANDQAWLHITANKSHALGQWRGGEERHVDLVEALRAVVAPDALHASCALLLPGSLGRTCGGRVNGRVVLLHLAHAQQREQLPAARRGLSGCEVTGGGQGMRTSIVMRYAHALPCLSACQLGRREMMDVLKCWHQMAEGQHKIGRRREVQMGVQCLILSWHSFLTTAK